MKYLSFLLLLFFSICCSSCSEEQPKEYEALSILNFGEGTYRPNPFKFMDTIPPFSWLGMPDTVKAESELEIYFNEDAVRSHSRAKIFLVDKDWEEIPGLKIGPYQTYNPYINASSDTIRIPVTFTVDPSIGEKELSGYVVFSGNDIDAVNKTEISSDFTPVGEWTFNHKIGVNLLRWVLLIVICLIILGIVGYVLFLLISLLGTLSSCIRTLSFTKIMGVGQKSINYALNNDWDGRDKHKKKRNPKIVQLERIIINPHTSLPDKATSLEQLFTFWDYELPESEKDFEAQMLDKRILSAMEELWDKYYNYTKKRMSWSGTPLDSTLLPDPETTPPNKNYSNVDNLTWGQIMKKHKFDGLDYHRGKPNFAKVAIHTIQIIHFDNFVVSDKDNERGPLQEEAFRILAKRLNWSIEAVRSYKENNRLVWHEDTNCKTLYLVPQEIHNNLNHFGGIGMLKILRKTGLYM